MLGRAFQPTRTICYHFKMPGPIGKFFLFPRGTTIVKVISVEDKPSLPDTDWHLMRFVDLRDGQEHGANFVEEIGDEFHPLPDDYPKEKIDAYVKAANDREDAADIMLDLEQEILLSGPPSKE